MLTRDNIAEHQARHGLSYHVPFALEAEEIVGLRGKRVIEIGGSLPEAFVRRDLGAASWIAIEEMQHWHQMAESVALRGNTPTPQRAVAAMTADDIARGYGVFDGRVEHLPAAVHGAFDVAFSIAAFEHVDRLALALDGAFAALCPGGRLFALFAPIWSSHDGHHLPDMRDRAGQVFNFSNSPIPPWAHLLMRPPELFAYLLERTDRQTAAEITYYVYHSPHINRLFTEDYIAYCRASPFVVERCDPLFPLQPTPEIQRELERRNFGCTQFANNGMLLILRKPEPTGASS